MYSHLVLGGTFDHLHAGHQDLLATAFSLASTITVGLTKPSMNRQKDLSRHIQPYRLRAQAILEFAKKQHREKDVRMIPIHDIFGTTLTDSSLEAILITTHTRPGAHIINQVRSKRGLPTLSILECPFHLDQADEILCSTSIRKGFADRQGFRFDRLLSSDHVLSEPAKQLLKRPFGKPCRLHHLRTSKDPIVLIGDVVTDYCVRHAVPFSSAYIDSHSQRKAFTHTKRVQSSILTTGIENPAGMITSRIAAHLQEEALQGQNRIFTIDGEEDLLTVAAVLLLPLKTRVVYGYPYTPVGMRCITITERIKEVFKALIL